MTDLSVLSVFLEVFIGVNHESSFFFGDCFKFDCRL